MYNWSTDETQLQKDEPRYTMWKLEQLINFGLNGSKLDEKILKQYWSRIMLDPARRRFLSLLLYGTDDPHQISD